MISLKNVTLRRGTKVLLDQASVTLNPGEKVGLVGRNGAGKSTLFALLNGTLHEDGGDFDMPKAWRMAQVAQNMPETEQPASEFVLEGDTRLAERPIHQPIETNDQTDSAFDSITSVQETNRSAPVLLVETQDFQAAVSSA